MAVEQLIWQRWPRERALRIREIIERLGVCGCGTNASWDCIQDLLQEAANHSVNGFYRDKWFEFGAHVLDKWDLLEHGTSIGFAWLTEDGKLLLKFLQDFGTDKCDLNEETGHPMWSIEFSWGLTPTGDDSYTQWFTKVRKGV